ncbi:MAG: metallophosphoesterase [Planctomycetota bacterium]|nr:metallophosphoesterase [Planctomycetota bacterium]
MSMQGVFLSDLHLLSRRSVGQRRWNEVRGELRRADWLVLGGDIFDFRWSRHRHLDASLDDAGNWLLDVMVHFPQLKIAYVLGNHDCLPPLRSVLRNLQQDCPRFAWLEYYFRLGDKVFLHGDVLDAGNSPLQLTRYRRRFAGHEKSRGAVANLLYDAAVASRMHCVPPNVLHSPERVTRRLAGYLQLENLTAAHGIQQVYFGHTHMPMRNVLWGHQAYYNAGSGIRHLEFSPCAFQVAPEHSDTFTRNLA